MEIPPLLPPDQMPPIVDQASLERHWRALVGELGFGRPRVWVLLIQGDRGLMVSEVDELPVFPEPGAPESLRHVFGGFEGVVPSFLYCRPGAAGLGAGDRAWVDALVAASGVWPVHVANDVELRVVARTTCSESGYGPVSVHFGVASGPLSVHSKSGSDLRKHVNLALT